jgi:cytochrome c
VLGPDEIARLDTDLAPAGTVPEGAGTARLGEPLYRGRCAHCHGPEGTGAPFDALGPGDAVPASARLVGRFWPQATTLYDYIRRAMPQTSPGTLTNDEAYALTAYVLFLNGLVDKQQRVDGQMLRSLVLPARDRFYESPESRRLVKKAVRNRSR